MDRLTRVGVSEQIPRVDVNIELTAHLTVMIGEGLVPCVYWQLTDPDFSLLEVGLEKETGLLRKLSVALYRGNIGTRASDPPRSETHGVPLFDVDAFPTDYEETFGRIRIDEGPGGWWTITLFDEPSGLQIAVPDLLGFGFNRQKELCEFSVNTAASYSVLGRKK